VVESNPDHEAVKASRFLLGGREPQSLGMGATIDLGETVDLTMLWPRTRVEESGNEESICLSLEYTPPGSPEPATRMLLTGDAEAPQLERIFALTENDVYEAFKVGHHGSKGAVTARQLELMECRFACISVGKDNRYGHPTAEILSLLEEADVRLYRTDLNGDISVLFSKGKVSVRCATMIEDLSSS
jgi:competence protein ComEC